MRASLTRRERARRRRQQPQRSAPPRSSRRAGRSLALALPSRFCFFFFTLVTGPRRSLSLKLSDTRVYEPPILARPSRVKSEPRVHPRNASIPHRIRAAGVLEGFARALCISNRTPITLLPRATRRCQRFQRSAFPPSSRRAGRRRARTPRSPHRPSSACSGIPAPDVAVRAYGLHVFKP